MKQKTLILLLLSITVCTLLLHGCSENRKKAIRTGDLLAPFSGTDLRGNPFSLASHRDKPVIVRFFLVDCPYCIADTPVFNAFYDRYREKGLEIVYINNNGSNAAAVEKFADDLKIQFPVIYDPEARIAGMYNIKAQPLTLILSPEHKLLAALLGGVSEGELKELLAQYLQG